MTPFANNVVSFAVIVVLRPLLFAVNVVSISACLQFEAFMFAVPYSYRFRGGVLKCFHTRTAHTRNDYDPCVLVVRRAFYHSSFSLGVSRH